MALWLDSNSEPQTEKEKADLIAIDALKEAAALELKEEGNEYVKKGKKHYNDAIDCYTRAINQEGLGPSEMSILFSNRAHVNMLLGNSRRAFEDAEKAIKLCPKNIKAFYRAAKASFSLDMLKDVISYCEQGLELSPDNEEFKKLVKLARGKLEEREKHEAEVSEAKRGAENLLSAFEDRGLKIGKPMFRELVGLKKPILDKCKMLHWPVLLLYPEVMSGDIIEDFCETDMFLIHLDMMFSESSGPLPWDEENVYTRENIELYYEVGSSVCMSKTQILHQLLEGTVGAGAINIDDEKGSSNNDSPAGADSSKWVKVNEKKTLYDVLKKPNLVIPGIPVFYVVSKSSTFYSKFKTGKWALPKLAGEDNA